MFFSRVWSGSREGSYWKPKGFKGFLFLIWWQAWIVVGVSLEGLTQKAINAAIDLKL